MTETEGFPPDSDQAAASLAEVLRPADPETGVSEGGEVEAGRIDPGGTDERTRRVLAAIFACGSAGCPRPFALYRHIDVTGVSGEGTVAHGVQFADGQVVIRWLGEYASTVVWASVDAAMKVHGHDGKTRLVWLATDFSEMAKAEREAAADEREKIAKLADQHHVRVQVNPCVCGDPAHWQPFADLIRELRQPPASPPRGGNQGGTR